MPIAQTSPLPPKEKIVAFSHGLQAWWSASSKDFSKTQASPPPPGADLLQVRDPESILVTCASGALGISLVLNLVWRKASLKEPGVQIRREMLVALSAYRFLKKSRKLEYGLR